MKKLRYIITAMIISSALISLSSCIVVHQHDNGKHKGWTKNPNNPHHPNTTNPGNAKGKGKH